jgi:hypothetical protein
VGKKGADNVASLIMKFLKQQGWLPDRKEGDEYVPGFELNIVMDNCAVSPPNIKKLSIISALPYSFSVLSIQLV